MISLVFSTHVVSILKFSCFIRTARHLIISTPFYGCVDATQYECCCLLPPFIHDSKTHSSQNQYWSDCFLHPNIHILVYSKKKRSKKLLQLIHIENLMYANSASTIYYNFVWSFLSTLMTSLLPNKMSTQ